MRLPFTAVEGLTETTARLIVQERLTGGRFNLVQGAHDRLALTGDIPEQLDMAGAFDSLGLDWRSTLFELETLRQAGLAGKVGILGPETQVPSFPTLSPDELLHLDLTTTGLSPTGRYPLDARRSRLRDLGCVALSSLRHGQGVWTAGLVVARQRPRSFATIRPKDERV